MIKNNNEWPDALIKKWLSSQQKYIDNWSYTNSSETRQRQNLDIQSWYKGLQHCWQHSTNQSREADQLFDNIANIGSSYVKFAEQIYATQEQNTGEIDLSKWLESTEQLYRNWSIQLNQLLRQTDAAFEPLDWDSWREISRTAFNLCNNLQSSFGDFKIPGADVVQDSFFNFIDMSEHIFFRKTEAELGHHLMRFNRYKKANVAFSLILAENSIQAIALFKNKITEDTAGNEEITSLKDIYELWVKINEKVYASSALSMEYQQAYGELINSYMAFKKGMDQNFAEHYKYLNLNTRTEFDNLLVSHKKLQNENKQLRSQINDLMARIDAIDKKSQ